MNQSELGRLEKANPREVWKNEATDFTPWLAEQENLKLLGDAIGADLELVSVEESVGSFYADILCKDAFNGTYVIIENQLTKTDHSHLGQLLIYAAGLNASTIIWIAERFTEEHRAALDWLNNCTSEDVNFFGLEIELWRIGKSSYAPNFNIVCKPNEWSRDFKGKADEKELSDLQRLQLEYWTVFDRLIRKNSKNIKPKRPRAVHSMRFSIQRSGFILSAIASTWNSEMENWDTSEIRAAITIDHRSADHFFDLLKKDKSEIEQALGEPLVWENLDGVKRSKIFLRKAADINNRKEWDKQHKWLLDRLEAIHAVFSPRISQLPHE